MFSILKKIVWVFIFLAPSDLFAQYNPQFYMRATESVEREKTYDRLIRNVILKNLSYPLSADTEENWEGAFNAMEVTGYKDSITRQKMREAMVALPFHSITFQRHMLEAAYCIYPGDFIPETRVLMSMTTDPKIFAMCAVYLLKSTGNHRDLILQQLDKTFGDSAINQAIITGLLNFMNNGSENPGKTRQVMKILLSKQFLPGQTVLYSFQRKNRDYPGLATIRKGNGEFVREDGNLFSIPQLARGIANLPYFLTKGNTPQGIYRMFGFGVSQSQFIGPTANIQMGMPVELKKNKFFDDKRKESEWNIEDYAYLLPASLRDYEPLYETYYAGLVGRNEIIAHGTTIDPEYYRGQPYYPMTPTEGCLSTKEFWDGKLIYSDQQKLVNALLSAGGAYGYVVVLEIDDKQKPVSVKEIADYLNEF